MERKAIITQSGLEQMLIDETAEPKALQLSLLESITGVFSHEQQIGIGGFAVVYKGIVGDRAVAVKRLSNAFMDEKEFHREVECLMRAKHKNIVRFLGYCADRQGNMEMYNGKLVMADVNQRLLCFEYIPKGGLDKYIIDTCREWGTCYEIIKGICEGIRYLHEHNIIHLDLKPANILLDDNMIPKITDFGLSRCFDENQSRHITKNVGGTMGYQPPELRKGGVIARSADLYSLGVIITEILTGHRGYEAIEDVLESWRDRLEKSQRDKLCEQIQVCYEIAVECRDFNPKKRPASARDIIERLHQIECIQISNKKLEPLCSVPSASSEHMDATLRAPHMPVDPTVVLPWPAAAPLPGSAHGLVETKHPLPAAAKIASAYEIVEPKWYLYVSVVKARDLPAMDLTGSVDPYVEVKLGNFKAVTKYFEQNRNPVWREKFTFPRDQLQSVILEVMVKDKDLIRDECVGRVVLDLSQVPSRLPLDSQLEPQWYRLLNVHSGDNGTGEIMLSVWFGTKHDESFPEEVHSLSHKGKGLTNTNSRRFKVYYSLKLMYLKVSVIEAQDLLPGEKGRPLLPAIVKLELGGTTWWTRPGQPAGSANPRWNEEFKFVTSEPWEEPLVVTLEEHVDDGRDDVCIGRLIIPVASPYKHLAMAKSASWFSLSRGIAVAGKAFSSKIMLRLSLETECHVL